MNVFISVTVCDSFHFRTINPSSGVNGAKSGGDYEAVVSQSIIMGPGIASSNVTVKIINDNIPELNEHFIVELTRAEVIGLPAGSNVVPIGEPKTVNVTIRANDQPFGLLGIYMKNTGGSGTNYAIIEPDSGATSVTFEVRRNQGEGFSSFKKRPLFAFYAFQISVEITSL